MFYTSTTNYTENKESMKTLSYILAFMAGLLIFFGLPLLGWGLGRHIPEFFTNPARLTFAIVIILLQLFSILYNPQVGHNRDDRKSGLQQHKMDLVLIQIFSLAIVIVAPFSDGHSVGILDIGNIIRFLGFLFLIPGFVLMQMAEKYLGRQFSIEVTLQKDHKLIQDGPYKLIRHPRYLGMLSFFLGISLVFRSLFGILILVAMLPVLFWRIFAEESLMQQEFGKDWETYRQKSWRILPFVF
jgi:protein-S-isoprenylcysteine O-methyltransferase Ste14